MDGDQGQTDGDPPIERSASESPMFVPQDNEEDTPSESGGPESASPEGATMSPEADHAEPSQPNEGDEDAPAQEQGEDADGNDEAEYNDNSSDDGEPCTRSCLKQAKSAARKLLLAEKRIIAKDKTIADLRSQLTKAKRDIRRLKAELKSLKGSDSTDEETSWQDLLQNCFGKNGGGKEQYQKAWKASYRALNMPTNLKLVHPQIRFIEGDGYEDDDDEHSGSRQSSPNDLESVRSDEEFRSTKPLPDNILYQILTELLTKDGLVHCFSRLDPCFRPRQLPLRQGLGISSTGIRGRFFISEEQRSYLSLTDDTEDPNTVLAALSVCRQWCFWGVNLFYGANTLSFSSLGELDRFAKGYGPARWSRVVNVELTWVGGKCVSFNLGDKSGEQRNRRTSPLAWFCEATSIKTLCIHIRESHKDVIRRRYEPYDHQLYMSGKTAGQPNYRMTRSMRACHGMDFIYQLRGLLWFRAYDLDKENVDPDRSSAKILNTSFVLDVSRVVTQEKVPARAEKSKLENLDPLFPVREGSWKPSRQDYDRVREIYTEDTGYDTRPNDLDYDATSSQGTIHSTDDSAAESDGDEDGDSSGSSFHSPPGPSRRRRPFTPAPSPGGADNSDHSDSGDSYDEEEASSVTTEDFRLRRLHQFLRDDSQEPA